MLILFSGILPVAIVNELLQPNRFHKYLLPFPRLDSWFEQFGLDRPYHSVSEHRPKLQTFSAIRRREVCFLIPLDLLYNLFIDLSFRGAYFRKLSEEFAWKGRCIKIKLFCVWDSLLGFKEVTGPVLLLFRADVSVSGWRFSLGWEFWEAHLFSLFIIHIRIKSISW